MKKKAPSQAPVPQPDWKEFFAKRKALRPNWHTWQNGDEIVMEATDLSQGQGVLVYLPDGSVQVRFMEAAQVNAEHDFAKDKARATKKKELRGRQGVQFDDEFLFVDHLMRLKEQEWEFDKFASNPYDDESIKALVNVHSKHAWKLIQMVANGDSESLAHIAGLIDKREKIKAGKASDKRFIKVAKWIETYAKQRWELTGTIERPEYARIVAKHQESTKSNERTDWRDEFCAMGFAWLMEKPK